MLFLLAAIGLGSPSSASPATVVPFANKEYKLLAPAGDIPPAGSGVPDCELGALAVKRVTDMAKPAKSGGGSSYNFELTNGGPDCAMQGGPTLTVISTSNPSLALHPKPTAEQAATGGKAINKFAKRWQLDAGDSVFVAFGVTGNYCDVLPDGVATVWFGGPGNSLNAQIQAPQCPIEYIAGDILESTAWTPRLPPNPPLKPTVFAGTDVTVTIDAPKTVRAGGQLVYTITFSNPSDSPVPLDPCPGYSQIFGEDGTTTQSTAYLNCDDAPKQVPANGSLSFEMRITAPGGPGSYRFNGEASLIWSTIEEQRLSTEAKVMVTA